MRRSFRLQRFQGHIDTKALHGKRNDSFALFQLETRVRESTCAVWSLKRRILSYARDVYGTAMYLLICMAPVTPSARAPRPLRRAPRGLFFFPASTLRLIRSLVATLSSMLRCLAMPVSADGFFTLAAYRRDAVARILSRTQRGHARTARRQRPRRYVSRARRCVVL